MKRYQTGICDLYRAGVSRQVNSGHGLIPLTTRHGKLHITSFGYFLKKEQDGFNHLFLPAAGQMDK